MLSEAAFQFPKPDVEKVVSACFERLVLPFYRDGKMHSSCYHPSLATSTSQTSHIENSWTDYQNGPREI